MKTKEVKRKEAQERNARWASLNNQAKLAELFHRPGLSQKQTLRIIKEMDHAA